MQPATSGNRAQVRLKGRSSILRPQNTSGATLGDCEGYVYLKGSPYNLSILPGKKRMLFTKAQIASIRLPTTRKGIDNNRRMGQNIKKSIKTSIAIGQQRTNRIAQRIRVSNVFIFLLLLIVLSQLPTSRVQADYAQQKALGTGISYCISWYYLRQQSPFTCAEVIYP